MTAIDALARVRRRGHVIWRSLVLVLAAAVPFLLAVAVVLVARLLGVIGVAPPGPVIARAVPLTGAGIAVLAVAGLTCSSPEPARWSLARRLPTRIRGPVAGARARRGWRPSPDCCWSCAR